MAVAAAVQLEKPRLVFFYSAESGRCRRVDGFLAQVLQQRRNHETFQVYRVDREQRPDLAERFHLERVPTLYVVEGKRVLARLEEPRGCRDIQRFLQPWLI
jgi:thioredoxin-like negative regulator of GroEL